ncbi:hypothetical protein HQ520_06990, partial [bacterium]|nr:hypothetical protein [bacterium]
MIVPPGLTAFAASQAAAEVGVGNGLEAEGADSGFDAADGGLFIAVLGARELAEGGGGGFSGAALAAGLDDAPLFVEGGFGHGLDAGQTA